MFFQGRSGKRLAWGREGWGAWGLESDDSSAPQLPTLAAWPRTSRPWRGSSMNAQLMNRVQKAIWITCLSQASESSPSLQQLLVTAILRAKFGPPHCCDSTLLPRRTKYFKNMLNLLVIKCLIQFLASCSLSIFLARIQNLELIWNLTPECSWGPGLWSTSSVDCLFLLLEERLRLRHYYCWSLFK